MLLLQLGAGQRSSAGAGGGQVVNVRARGAHARDARSSADRGAIAVVHVDTPRKSALARWASSSDA
eukprot:5540165-Prymnesium_polylepis.1